MKISLSRYKIDWPNHIIGFFSALFGILIAFELDEWREQKNQAEVVSIAFENLKKEILINQSNLHENVTSNVKHITTLQEILNKLDNQLRFTGTSAEAGSINKNFSQVIFIEKRVKNSRGESNNPIAFIGMENIRVPTLHNSAWESAKATGTLNLMQYEKVLSLSFLYNPPGILEELTEIRNLWRRSDNVIGKTELSILLMEMIKAHRSIENELLEFDQFVNILNAME